MRIICDHCNRPISGTVTRVPGNLNFHPDCQGEAAEGSMQEPTKVSWDGLEACTGSWLEDGSM